MVNASNSWFDNQALKFEQSRFASMVMILIVQSCWAAVGGAMALEVNNYVTLTITAMLAMIGNGIIIAQSTAKICLGSFYAVMLGSTFVILWHLIS